MSSYRDRLDEYVRRITRPSPEDTAALGDSTAKQALFEEIMKMSDVDTPRSPTPSLPRRRRTVVAAGAATVVVALAIAVVVMLTSTPQRPVATPSPTQSTEQTSPAAGQGDVFGPGIQTSCVEEYNPQTLAQRGFAFDGTVVSIGAASSTADGPDPYAPVGFRVNHWYRGASGTQITVAMFPPTVVTSAGNAVYGVGSRLLVSGESRAGGADPLKDPISWACGFTRWYTDTDARVWEQAFR